ncbi:MAG: CxxC-x17-CxxC domain-containing protein [Candidatus Nealsonbacteria bacterium]
MASKNEIILLGETTFRNQRKRFGIKTDDRRRHVYIIGKTGMGKTALLENMAIQDIRAGKGVGIIDPHGEAAEKLLDFVPAKRVNDVIYFNPADLNFPMPFNVMEKVTPENRHLVASGLMDVFKKIWPDVWSARMEYILSNSILALLEDPNSTLLGINRMLADPDYRKKVVERVKDPMVKSFWVNEFARYTQRYEVEATAAIQNKIGQLISNPLIRNIIGQVKSKLNMRKMMDERKIFIANLSKGRIGEENSRLLGALLVTKLQLSAMSRVDIPEKEREDFFLYVDEFQNFATEAFADILSEARKYRLSLTLANQYMAQLEEMTALGRSTKVRDAVFGNVGTFVVFRVGAEDAEYLEKEFVPEIIAEDLVNLAKYNIYIKLMVDGIAGRPFSAYTIEPYKLIEDSHKEKIIKLTRERYGIERRIVEDKIKRWMGGTEFSETFQSEQTVLYDAICSSCGKKTKLTFKPEKGRPVYCKQCLKNLRKKKEEAFSLKETEKLEPVSFFRSKKTAEKEKPKREKRKVDIEELKKNLKKALKKEE